MTALNEFSREFIIIDGANDHRLPAYLARPQTAGPERGAVIVGMELFGLSSHVRDVCDRLAEAGYVAVAPFFFHRDSDEVELPVDDEGRERGLALLRHLTRNDAVTDLLATSRWIERGGSPLTAMVGLSVGGHLAFLAATQLDLPLSIVFYGGWLAGTELLLGQPEPTLSLTPLIRGRIRIFVGTDDAIVPVEDRRSLRAALIANNVDHELTEYVGVGHGFLADGRPGFDARAASDAWQQMARELGSVHAVRTELQP